MSNSSSSSSSGGIGFVGLLTIVFITLKLLHKIDWGWQWVLAPIWISILLVILVVLIFLIATGTIRIFRGRPWILGKNRRNRKKGQPKNLEEERK